jgi:SNF2-related domain
VKFTPHPYQTRAVQFCLDTPYALLALEMGLGKSVITSTALARLLDTCEVTGRVLVVAPKRVAQHQWPAEVAKWDHTRHLRVSLVLGPVKARIAALLAEADLHVVNRENLAWLVQESRARRLRWDVLVLDESTSFKSRDTQRWRAARALRAQARRCLLLTGTPAPNGYLDLWAQLALVDQGARLGRTLTAYRERWFVADYLGYTWAEKPGARAEIDAALADVTLAMRAEDWLALPEAVTVDVPVPLPGAALAEYRRMEREGLMKLRGKEITAAGAAAVANKLTQAASGAVYDAEGAWHALHDAKLDALEDLLEAAGGPVLVAYRYRHEVARIQARFPQAVEAREPGALGRWNARQVPLLLIHPASAGHGLNLQDGGRHVVWISPTWSLEEYLQTNARLHRQGQRETVIVHRLVATGTIDARILEVLGGKWAGLANMMRVHARQPMEDPGGVA